MGNIVAIDQGTTSTRALVFSAKMDVLSLSQQELRQYFPKPGWVEHDPEEIWQSVVANVRSAIEKAGVKAHQIAALGITNQRETTIVWDRESGKPVHPAIVWQDRRTTAACARLRAEGLEHAITAKTGLLADPYFSATKIAWILDHVEGARAAALAGRLAFGTIDSFLIWRLTGGKVHATDATNAARTLLFDIHRQDWDDDLLREFAIPRALLPEVKDCAADFGLVEPELFGASIPIAGVAGDQHAAMLGQACFQPGMMKSTYGTGCFAMLNTGDQAIPSQNRLLTTLAYRLEGKPTYALEGSIFIAGAALQWLRDGLKIIEKASDADSMAETAGDGGIYFVPAFVGLGAPHWDAQARGAIFGLSRGTSRADIVRAALEAVCFQTHDLLDAMRRDINTPLNAVLRVDGGMVASDWTMQCLADVLDVPVDRPKVLETTVLGAAWLAGSHVGVFPDQAAFAARWHCERRFVPKLSGEIRTSRLSGWQDAVRRTLSKT
ncbi:MAG: glycerol kinase GlpK [Rhizobiales bacterium]|nr:glycerol kinase GlpK [Hyphomicrobiales bacterium]